ncbi:hypothetical protein DY000_02031037 [Brassica cretica]|uniref:Uncharacterized protein n=1 Tax=Brassica cretica TaxID=69181 RepID=A0ABQ7DX60_BRACR|nr:hypothetical protein DY000_02031037 [Brassica cretica]
MAVEEQNELPEATPREAELQRKLDEVQSLKEKLDEHSKQLEQSAEKLSQLESESEPEPDKEAPEGAAKTESPMVAYLEHMFSKRLDAMQSMVERLPG